MLNQAPNEWTIAGLIDHIRNGPQAGVKVGTTTVWQPARSFGDFSLRTRVRLAWMVFTGKADALRWPGQDSHAHFSKACRTAPPSRRLIVGHR